MTTQKKPSIGRVVIYNHPGSADGKWPAMKSPAIVQSVYTTAVDPNDPGPGNHEVCDLFVMSVTNGIFFAKQIPYGDTGSHWSWPVIEE